MRPVHTPLAWVVVVCITQIYLWLLAAVVVGYLLAAAVVARVDTFRSLPNP